MERSRLLLVAASANFRRTLSRLLGRSGYEITEASSAEQALEALAGEPFHALLAEVSLPGTSGLTLLCRIREQGLSLPTVLLTEEETTRLRGVLEEVPHAQCLRLPVEPGALKSAIARCVAAGPAGP